MLSATIDAVCHPKPAGNILLTVTSAVVVNLFRNVEVFVSSFSVVATFLAEATVALFLDVA